MRNQANTKIVLSDESAKIPHYATKGSAAVDLRTINDVTLQPRQVNLVETGIKVALPAGHFMMIAPRSGLALSGITVANSPGIVDEDYRGGVRIALVNHSENPVHLRKGERVAQALLMKCERFHWSEVLELETTERGEGGFGSTGTV